MFPTINKKETGVNLRRIMDMRGVKPKDIQEYLGFGCVQSVYRWLDGVSMPTVDNLYAITGKLVIRDGRKLRRYKEMEPMYLQVLQKETGRQIKKLLVENGYTVKDVQNAMGFENPQAVYKWISGRSLPSLDNFVILSRLLHTSIEDILVIDGDIVRLWGFSFKLLVQ